MRRSSALLLAGWPLMLGVGYLARPSQPAAPRSLERTAPAPGTKRGAPRTAPPAGSPRAGGGSPEPLPTGSAARASEPREVGAPAGKAGEADRVRVALDELLGATGPQDAALLTSLAEVAQRHRRSDVALRLLHAAVRLAPRNAEALLALAVADPAQLSRLDGLELDFLQAVRCAELLTRAGRSKQAARRLEAALLAEPGKVGEDLERLLHALLAVAPDVAAAHAGALAPGGLALVIEKLPAHGRPDLAQRVAHEALQSGHPDPRVVSAALRVIPAEALARGEALRDTWPRDPGLVGALAAAYLALGRPEAVERLVGELEVADALSEVSWVLLEAGREAHAIRAIERAVELEPDRAYEVGLVLPYSQAIALLERRLSAAPRFEVPLLRDALCRLISIVIYDDPAAAVRALERHGEAWPARNAPELLEAAERLEETHPSAAARWRRRARELDPSLAEN